MARAIRVRRKNAFNLHKEAAKLGSFDEFPMLRSEVDPQIHASHNSVDQPFHLRCEKDSVIAQITGRSRVEFTDGSVRFFDLVPADFVYVPGGSAHRITIVEPGTMIRYKARLPGRESVVWRCHDCGNELDRREWNADEITSQSEYLKAVEEYNGDAHVRHCASCGQDNAPVDLSPFRWAAIAEALDAPEE